MAYGLVRCERCSSDPGEDCGDHCGSEWPVALPPLWLDMPLGECDCCGQPAQLVSVLEPLAV